MEDNLRNDDDLNNYDYTKSKTIIKWRGPQFENKFKTKITTKIENYLKLGDDLKIKEDLKNEDDLKMEDDLMIWTFWN